MLGLPLSLYQTILDDVPVGICRIRTDGSVDYANRTLLTCLGFATLAELQTTQKGLPREEVKRVLDEQAPFDGSGPEVRSIDADWFTRDGGCVKFRESVCVIRDSTHAILHLDVALQQIDSDRPSLLSPPLKDDRYQRVVDNLREVIFQIDTAGAWAFLNRAWTNVTGFEINECLGRRFLDFVHQEDERRVAEEFQRHIAGETEFCRIALRYKSKSGAPRWVETYSRLMRDEGGTILGTTGTLTDITQRKLVEEALRDSEERYRKLVEISPDAILVHDKGRLLYANPASLALMRATSAEMLYAKPLLEFVHPDSREIVRRRFATMTDEGANVPVIEERFIRLDGTSLDVEVTGAPFMYGGKQVFLVVVRDISERKRAEAIIRRRGLLREMMFQKNAAVMLLVDPATATIVDANPAAAEFYGVPLERLTSMSVFAINAHPEEYVRGLFAQAKQDQQDTFFVKHRRADGSIRDVEIHSSPMTINGNTVLFSIIHDITDRLEAQRRLQSSLKEKEVLLKEVHHRVKNNLNVVAGLLSLQSRFVKSSEDAILFDETKARILAMGKVHQNLYRSEDLSAIDLSEYLKELVESVSSTFGTPGVTTKLDLSPVSVGIDQAIPCGLIVNELLTNCHKYAFRGRGSGNVTVSCHPAGDAALTLAVRDDGVGLPEGVDFTGLRTLGLSLVSMLAEQIDGTLSIDREGGTTFRLVLPRPSDPTDSRPSEQ